MFAAALALVAVVPPALAGAQSPADSGTHGIAWTTQQVAPGLEVRSGVLRDPSAAGVWTVTVQAPTVNRLTGAATWAPLGDRAWADATAGRLREAGLEPRLEAVEWDTYADTPRGVMGWQVRVGRYATQAEAGTANAAVVAAGFRTSTEWTGYDGRQAADGERIHVAVVDPARLRGSVAVSDGGNVADREKTSVVAGRLGSLLGVNGGFFITSDSDGVQGTVAGLSAVDGKLESMAVGSRAALVLGDGGRRPRIADLSTTVTVRAAPPATRCRASTACRARSATAAVPVASRPSSPATTRPAPWRTTSWSSPPRSVRRCPRAVARRRCSTRTGPCSPPAPAAGPSPSAARCCRAPARPRRG